MPLPLPSGWTLQRVDDDGDGRFRVDDLFPDAGPTALRTIEGMPEWSWLHDDDADWMRMTFSSWVLRTRRHLVLVDTCLGNDKPRPRRPAWDRRDGDFLSRLQGIGVTPDDVDVVICTHLHADHVGWNTVTVGDRWVPTFPRARYVLGRTEVEWMLEQEKTNPGLADGSFADSVRPVMAAGQAELVDGGWELEPGVALRLAPGHTPGNLIVELRDPTEPGTSAPHTVLCGDVVHHPVQLAHPEWSTRLCVDAELSRHTRCQSLASWAAHGTAMYPAHFRGPGGGQLVRDGDRYHLH